ncbi:hypothetical protein POSPLADRAFT_1035388 [Postia placenta MAD-698-R-SB12]|uniref:Vacuolar fusion protein MON1 n=1 Tax=Postia placenta MAD-698-R-SB12 TaxID=670580 RepID=A0A1X6MU30_9APHY|nr:hypothetical protein POSPLADRAFT_1035388 [Postia placenta MAD-698-R-SB12]OSX59875.1 hypothetical protein POSPLADRAFT_1035388 [Postia placenta MAD-698-R-SB12]
MVHGSHEGASSSASSALTVEAPTPEGMLVQEVDVEVIDGEQGTASAIPTPRGNDEESKQHLREQLRRTLNKKESSHATSCFVQPISILRASTSSSPRPENRFSLGESSSFLARQEDEASDNFTSTIGVMQALVSIFLDDGDKLRCINAGNTRITFLLRPPLYYACVSSWGEAESVFLQNSYGACLSGVIISTCVDCSAMEPMLRKSIADVLVPTSKIKDILYVILIAQGKVITLVRPKKHSIHPSDLHILVNTIHSPSIINSSAAASWLPVCLPKFNSAAFVNAYVMFLRKEDQTQEQQSQHSQQSPTVQDSDAETRDSAEQLAEAESSHTLVEEQPAPEVCLVCVSGSADFEAVRNWCNTINQRLMQDGLLGALTGAISRGETEYAVGDLGVPGLRHFVYKSRSHVQVTMPLFEDPYDNPHEKRRLTTLYQTLYDAIHAKSGQGSTLKLQYIRTERESVMGWITQPFELYLALSPLLPKSGIVNAANAVAKYYRMFGFADSDLTDHVADVLVPVAPVPACHLPSTRLLTVSRSDSPSIMSWRLASQALSCVPRFCRALQNKAALRPVPAQLGAISSPSEFLKAIGRSADTKVTAETWEDLWEIDGLQLKKAGLAVRDRRYILWSMEKFRQGEDPAQFAHPPTPKKKILMDPRFKMSNAVFEVCVML